MARRVGRPRPRQADIARAAGVSQATVSMVINNRVDVVARIGPETRRRVLAAVEELGYSVNPVARSLVGGMNQVIGVYTFESVFPTDSLNFFHPFLIGVEREAEIEGYDLLLFTSATGSGGQRRIYRNNVNRFQMADGCVLLGEETDRQELARLAAEEFPFVFIGRRELADRAVTYVAADYTGATLAVLEHLAALGHRRVAYLEAVRSLEPSAERDDAFRLAQQRYGLAGDARFMVPARAGGLDSATFRDLLDAGVTAFVTQQSDATRRLLELGLELGLRPPVDFSLATLIDPPQDLPIPLTCTGLRVPRDEMGAVAVRMLVEKLTDPFAAENPHVVLPCAVTIGDSTGPPAR